MSVPSRTLCLPLEVANEDIWFFWQTEIGAERVAMVTALRVSFCFFCDAHLWGQVSRTLQNFKKKSHSSVFWKACQISRNYFSCHIHFKQNSMPWTNPVDLRSGRCIPNVTEACSTRAVTAVTWQLLWPTVTGSPPQDCWFSSQDNRRWSAVF